MTARDPARWRAREKLKRPGEPGGPCLRCLRLALDGRIRTETVMPLPPPGQAPLARDGSGPCCHDCQSADTIGALLFRRPRSVWAATEAGGHKHPLDDGMPFDALRIVVGNDRQDSLRLPEELRPHFGLVAQGLVRASVGPDALDDHHAWMESVGIAHDGDGEDGIP